MLCVYENIGLDRTVVSIPHCGCGDLGLIPSLDIRMNMLQNGGNINWKVIRKVKYGGKIH